MPSEGNAKDNALMVKMFDGDSQPGGSPQAHKAIIKKAKEGREKYVQKNASDLLRGRERKML